MEITNFFSKKPNTETFFLLILLTVSLKGNNMTVLRIIYFFENVTVSGSARSRAVAAWAWAAVRTPISGGLFGEAAKNRTNSNTFFFSNFSFCNGHFSVFSTYVCLLVRSASRFRCLDFEETDSAKKKKKVTKMLMTSSLGHVRSS